MTVFDALIDLDGNGRPIYGDSPFRAIKDVVFTGDSATVNTPIFTITGAVMVTRLWGIITTVLGTNHTAASWRLNDQGAQVYLTAIGGTTLSAKKAGSVIIKKDLVSAALTLVDNAAGAISEPTTLETMLFSPIMLVKKTAALTQIEYRYTTSDSPTSGAMRFFASYYPLSRDGVIATA